MSASAIPILLAGIAIGAGLTILIFNRGRSAPDWTPRYYNPEDMP